jgi:hypothetical protein
MELLKRLENIQPKRQKKAKMMVSINRTSQEVEKHTHSKRQKEPK